MWSFGEKMSKLAAQEFAVLTTPYALTVKMIQRGKGTTRPIPSETNNVSWQPVWKASSVIDVTDMALRTYIYITVTS